MERPQPTTRIVTHMIKETSHIYIACADEAARAWIKDEAPQYGYLEPIKEIDRRYDFRLTVYAVFNPYQVAQFLEYGPEEDRYDEVQGGTQ
jgi:hypothetical protein